jgi:hypothetical protein
MSAAHTLSVIWDLDRVGLDIICHAPDDAPCHQHCPSGCLYGPCEHPREPGWRCNAAEFIGNVGTEDCAITSIFRLSYGMPVEVTWDSTLQSYVWGPVEAEA